MRGAPSSSVHALKPRNQSGPSGWRRLEAPTSVRGSSSLATRIWSSVSVPSFLIGGELRQLRAGGIDDFDDGREGERELLLLQPAHAVVPRGQLAAGAAVDVVERLGRELGVDAAVHEDGAVDLGEDWLRRGAIFRSVRSA